MDPFTADYLANLTADLTAQVVTAAGRRLREALAGTEEEQALRRCLQAGLVALLAQAIAAREAEHEPEARDLLAEIFRDFLGDPDVGRELAALLRGNPPDVEELAYLFEAAGYEAETLPGLDFQQGMAAFEAAFLAAAIEEPALQGTIQTGQLLAQTPLLRDMLAAMQELVAFLRQARPGSVGIGADQITAENVVSGVQIVYQLPRVEAAAPPADWEGHYLRSLISRCDPLDLAPIDEALPQDARPVHISDVFTTLHLERLTRTPGQSVREAIRRPHLAELSRSRAQEKEEERLPIQAVEAVAALPRLVILGRPGGGKSTLVNHVATQLARRRLGESGDGETLPGWSAEGALLPVRIILRRFAAWLPADEKHVDAGHVWEYLEHQLRQWGCREACDGLKRTLTEEGGVVFFDGLDEVRETDEEAERSLIKEAIAAFAAPLDKCKVIVTCREYAYKQGDAWRLPEAEFPVVELALFTMEQIEAFTRTWYQVVGPQKGWDEAKCQDEASNLFKAAQAWPHLQELAQYPLLLTLMAQVHGRDGTLPQDRADLYERAVNLLLAHWENRIVRDVDGSQRVEPGLVMQLGIHTTTLRTALERVAFDAHERQEREPDRSERAADIPREDLRDVLHADLGSVDRADTVITYVQERAGLLQARDNRTYAFPHRTFQEYLAAAHMLKQAEFDTMLRDRVRRDPAWWQEVFLLAAGASRGTPRNISDLVDCLLPLGPGGEHIPAEKADQARLAAQALRETKFAAHVRKEEEPGRFSATFRRVQGWLLTAIRSDASLSPAERAASGDELGRLSDPRFRADAWFLPDEPLLGFVEVPAGPFLMGSDKKRDRQALDRELPQHRVTLPTYYVARYPVTVAQFRAFVETSGFQPGNPTCLRGVDNHPVVRVSWHEARAYCAWLTERFLIFDFGFVMGGRVDEMWLENLKSKIRNREWVVRLPTEAEWEKAARGTDGRIYPWDGEPDANRMNYNLNLGGTSAVGCFPGGASPYGAEDLSGNVWEWMQSLWGKDSSQPEFKYPYDPEDGRERLDDNGRRVLRGGAFSDYEWSVRCAYRHWYVPGVRHFLVGFRVVVAPVPLVSGAQASGL
jgi:formylglycine-generating enzyme required for sulfatase activity